MALKTLGTVAETTLSAFVGNSDFSAADAAQVRANIKYDGVNNNSVFPGAFEFVGQSGLLYIPRRGVLQVMPGDYVAYDASGWPILISKNAIIVGGSSWAHN